MHFVQEKIQGGFTNADTRLGRDTAISLPGDEDLSNTRLEEHYQLINLGCAA